jgi:hypothetical protein
VPGAPIRIDLRVGGVGQRTVGRTSVFRPVDP